MKLQLSEAIRLGSLMVSDPRACDIERCAITMALKAIGAMPENLDDARAYRVGQWNVLAYPEQTLRDAYPWIDGSFHCRWCDLLLRAEGVICHPFDVHVMASRRATIEELCDWIATIEPRTLTSGVRGTVPSWESFPPAVPVTSVTDTHAAISGKCEPHDGEDPVLLQVLLKFNAGI